MIISSPHQSEDDQERCDGERGADGGGVETPLRAREGEKRQDEDHHHQAGGRTRRMAQW